MSKRDWLVAVGIALSAVFVVACGGSGGSGSTAGKAEVEEAQLEFAACMREHGVEVADPKPGQPGILIQSHDSSGGAEKGLSGGPDDPAMKKATAACDDKLKDAMPEPSPQQQEEAKEDALEFAQCMREHGIDMPDPQFSGDGKVKMTIKGPKGDPNSPLMEEAQEACQGKMPGMLQAKP